MGDEWERHTKDGLPLVPFADAAELEAWLAEHHATSPGVWLKLAKKASGLVSVTLPEAIEVAVCFGWIDGQKGSYDATWFLQRFTPRRPRSIWSKSNTDKVGVLIASGRMRPASQLEVDRAKADGRWERAYAGQATAEIPPVEP